MKNSPSLDPVGTSLLRVKDRPDRQSCLEELNSNESWRFLIGFWERFSDLHNFNMTLLGVYANGQTFGQDTIIHRDNKTHPGFTVIVFCNEYWPTSWGGELVFYDDNKENIVKAVLPKSRRVVIFDGRIPHAARSPSVKCDQVRMTLVFKTVIKE
ncbi:MAG: 2OG-Fe(II) oxygenase [Pseudomonas sp.]|uniref:2OG-Fe(II) oxygenase n=1 Tax=Pseudomonas sp. TaxID=306 RepID=UPI003D6F5BD7